MKGVFTFLGGILVGVVLHWLGAMYWSIRKQRKIPGLNCLKSADK